MRQHDSRSLRSLHLALAATAFAVVASGQPILAAEPAPGQDGRNPLGAEPGCRACIFGSVSVQWNGTSGSFHVDRVEIRGPVGIGDLALQVQLQRNQPQPDDFGVGEIEFSDRVLLNRPTPGGPVSNIDSGPIAFYPGRVPAGEYWMIMMLLTGYQQYWGYYDYVLLKDKVSCDGSTCSVGGPCSIARVAGEWGYSWTGTFLLPTGATPAAATGTYTTDATGQLTGTQSSSVGGVVAQDLLKGAIAVNADCTGTLTAGLYDSSGNLLRTAVWGLVFVDDVKEVRGVFKSLVLPNGMSLPTIATAEGKRLGQSRTGGETAAPE